eukprot:2932247-Alexandrium_andersonii.AAC.1
MGAVFAQTYGTCRFSPKGSVFQSCLNLSICVRRVGDVSGRGARLRASPVVAASVAAPNGAEQQ